MLFWIGAVSQRLSHYSPNFSTAGVIFALGVFVSSLAMPMYIFWIVLLLWYGGRRLSMVWRHHIECKGIADFMEQFSTMLYAENIRNVNYQLHNKQFSFVMVSGMWD